MVLTFQENKWLDAFTQAYLMSLANAIEDAQMHQEVSVLEEIKKVYLMDPLTGIYNRRGFEKGLRTLREKMSDDDFLSIVSIDMDGLKYINDNFGHAEGDDALMRLANVIKGLVEEGTGELCARMGGDEFSMLLLSKDKEKHLNFASRFQKAMMEEEKRVQKPYPFRASVGICCIGEENNLSLMACMQLADKRMYIQKKSKRGCRFND